MTARTEKRKMTTRSPGANSLPAQHSQEKVSLQNVLILHLGNSLLKHIYCRGKYVVHTLSPQPTAADLFLAKLEEVPEYMGHPQFLENTFWVPSKDRKHATIRRGPNLNDPIYVGTLLGEIGSYSATSVYGDWTADKDFPKGRKFVIALTQWLDEEPHPHIDNLHLALGTKEASCPFGTVDNPDNWPFLKGGSGAQYILAKKSLVPAVGVITAHTARTTNHPDPLGLWQRTASHPVLPPVQGTDGRSISVTPQHGSTTGEQPP
ncbi:hypothetical protein DFS34DRAFT_686010 [Phlyctochytrium arcticum]|nr:hypothetical protein DFS34DRAFT_686010 [Phlyctochytrium arcticum]